MKPSRCMKVQTGLRETNEIQLEAIKVLRAEHTGF